MRSADSKGAFQLLFIRKISTMLINTAKFYKRQILMFLDVSFRMMQKISTIYVFLMPYCKGRGRADDLSDERQNVVLLVYYHVCTREPNIRKDSIGRQSVLILLCLIWLLGWKKKR